MPMATTGDTAVECFDWLLEETRAVFSEAVSKQLSSLPKNVVPTAASQSRSARLSDKEPLASFTDTQLFISPVSFLYDSSDTAVGMTLSGPIVHVSAHNPLVSPEDEDLYSGGTYIGSSYPAIVAAEESPSSVLSPLPWSTADAMDAFRPYLHTWLPAEALPLPLPTATASGTCEVRLQVFGTMGVAAPFSIGKAAIWFSVSALLSAPASGVAVDLELLGPAHRLLQPPLSAEPADSGPFIPVGILRVRLGHRFDAVEISPMSLLLHGGTKPRVASDPLFLPQVVATGGFRKAASISAATAQRSYVDAVHLMVDAAETALCDYDAAVSHLERVITDLGDVIVGSDWPADTPPVVVNVADHIVDSKEAVCLTLRIVSLTAGADPDVAMDSAGCCGGLHVMLPLSSVKHLFCSQGLFDLPVFRATRPKTEQIGILRVKLSVGLPPSLGTVALVPAAAPDRGLDSDTASLVKRAFLPIVKPPAAATHSRGIKAAPSRRAAAANTTPSPAAGPSATSARAKSTSNEGMLLFSRPKPFR